MNDAERPATKPQTKHEEFASKIISLLEKDMAPWQKPWKAGEHYPPFNPVSGTVYSGLNRVMLSDPDYADPRWMTFKQAQSKKYRVKKGSKSRPIVHWQWTEAVDKLDEDGRPILDATGNPEKEILPLERPRVRFFSVFHASQLEMENGRPIPPFEPKELEWNPHERAEAILEASGADIIHDQRDRGFYSLQKDEIHLPPKENFANEGDYYPIAFHELGHWTRHPSRLNRENGPFGSEMYAKEELRAHIASWMMSQDLGIDFKPDQHHASYVKDWVKVLKDDPYEIMRACRDAERINQYVMSLDQQREQTAEITFSELEEKNGPAVNAVSEGLNTVDEKSVAEEPTRVSGSEDENVSAASLSQSIERITRLVATAQSKADARSALREAMTMSASAMDSPAFNSPGTEVESAIISRIHRIAHGFDWSKEADWLIETANFKIASFGNIQANRLESEARSDNQAFLAKTAPNMNAGPKAFELASGLFTDFKTEFDNSGKDWCYDESTGDILCRDDSVLPWRKPTREETAQQHVRNGRDNLVPVLRLSDGRLLTFDGKEHGFVQKRPRAIQSLLFDFANAAAVTEVTTDILFFQKSKELEPDPAWLKTGQITDLSGQNITLNQYFIDHPEQMAGQMVMSNKMFREAADLLPNEDFAGFKEEIGKRLDCLPQDVYQARAVSERGSDKRAYDQNRAICTPLKINAFFVTTDGRIARRRMNIVDYELGEIPQYEIIEPKNKMAGERIAGMVKLRDSLTELMATEQVDGVNESLLNRWRADLNRVYDDFINKYGYINSMANRQAFRDDPEYYLLCSLERDYNPGISKAVAQKTGREAKAPSAKKADIFTKRVLGPRKIITQVETAKEALIVSMNEYGRPDLDFMSGLCGKPVDDLTAELADLIYNNPLTMKWELADHYLTGNVKIKLKEAREAAARNGEFRKNVEALLAVQPPDLEPVDICVNLGSSWVPPEDVADFCRHLLGPNSVEGMGYHPALGSWATSFNKSEIDPTLNSSTWGTERYWGHDLITAVLNHTPIKVMDVVGMDENRNPIYKLNEDETIAAGQKAEEIKQAFQDWIWLDQNRRDRLAKLYNDKFNTHLPRKYDGSHLELPGSSLAIELRKHQKDVIWRGIQDGTALFDHTVGAGKTLAVVGTIMESRRMGLMKKPMVVVPNHILGQWQDAFYSLYPQAKILVATKDDFTKENRQKLFSSIATGDWDAVVVPHSSFKKIGLPPETLQEILGEQVNDLMEAIEKLKMDNGEPVLIKQMEKAKDRLESIMERKAQTGKKDEAVTFDKLGVDALFCDESQEFKNLAFITKMRNIAGLGNVAGSDKAFDLYVKARHIQKEHDGKGVFFATGTPISNSIAEMYTVQRYLQYDLLKEKGLAHFDAWASTFGQTATGWELDATGVGYKINTRFSKFQNVPELINMYRTVADVITPTDLKEQNQGVAYTPKIKGGKPQNIVVKRSDQQALYMGLQEQRLDGEGLPVFDSEGNPVMEWTPNSIIHRMENLPKDPRMDNPLKITNDARKAGLDFRLIDPEAPDHEGSKVNLAADNIHRLWKEWEDDRGTQLVFCDLSTPKMGGKDGPSAPDPSPKNGSPEDDPSISMDELISTDSKFSVYADLKQKLIDRGIPSDEIKFIHEAKTDAQKAKLFEAVNTGQVRVLIGSTAKMGAGTNVQQRLVGLHHLDCPWRPSDLEQREGRIIRQGNELFKRDPDNFEIEIIRYATEQTYDSRMWQVIQGKAEGIEQFRKGDTLTRTIDDVSGEAANAAEMKAAASGNELIFTQVKLASELKKMESVYSNFVRGQHQLERRIKELETAPAELDRQVAHYEQEIETRNKNTTTEHFFAVDGKIYGKKDRKELLFEIARVMKKVKDKDNFSRQVGEYRGFSIMVEPGWQNGSRQFVIASEIGRYEPSTLCYKPGEDFNINGFLQRLDNRLDKFESQIQEALDTKKRKAAELETAYQSRGQSFAQMELLEALREDNREVMTEIQKTRKDPTYKSTWAPKSYSVVQSNTGPQHSKPSRQSAGLSL